MLKFFPKFVDELGCTVGEYVVSVLPSPEERLSQFLFYRFKKFTSLKAPRTFLLPSGRSLSANIEEDSLRTRSRTLVADRSCLADVFLPDWITAKPAALTALAEIRVAPRRQRLLRPSDLRQGLLRANHL